MKRSRSVLIIEDEPLISMMLEDFLDALGHAVAGTVDSVPDALARIDEAGFDLAILDVHLRNNEASWPVADLLADRGIAYLFSTGGYAELAPERHRGAPTLSKPFTMADVGSAIDAIP